MEETMQQKRDTLEQGLELLGLPKDIKSKLCDGYVNGTSELQLPAILWLMAEMNYLMTQTNFPTHKTNIHAEIYSGPFIARRGLVSERAKKLAIQDNPEAYQTFKHETMTKIQSLSL